MINRFLCCQCIKNDMSFTETMAGFGERCEAERRAVARVRICPQLDATNQPND
jgi:hypothetical protein